MRNLLLLSISPLVASWCHEWNNGAWVQGPFEIVFARNMYDPGHPDAPSLTIGTLQGTPQADLVHDLALDYYTHSIHAPVRPTVLWVHGGGFQGSTKRDDAIPEIAAAFGQRNFVIAAADYRLLGHANLTDAGVLARLRAEGVEYFDVDDGTASGTKAAVAVRDIITALNFIRSYEQATVWKINTAKVMVGGDSAGAITTLWLGYIDIGVAFTKPVALMVVSGGRFHETADHWEADGPPAVLVHGTADPWIPLSDGKAIHKAMGRRSDLHVVVDGNHVPMVPWSGWGQTNTKSFLGCEHPYLPADLECDDINPKTGQKYWGEIMRNVIKRMDLNKCHGYGSGRKEEDLFV